MPKDVNSSFRKLRGQRAKAMKFTNGYMIKSGDAAKSYVDKAVRHLALKQGMLGIRVAIMLPYDPTLKNGGTDYRQPDVITIHEPPVYKKSKKRMPAPEAAPQDPAPEAAPQNPQ